MRTSSGRFKNSNEAVQRPKMRFVPLKSTEQQDVQTFHRARQRLVNHRTAPLCQIRGILLDRGIVFAPSATRVRRLVPAMITDLANDLSPMARETLASLLELLHELDARITVFDRRIDGVFRASPVCQRIARVEGVGPKTATAVVAAVGDGRDFRPTRRSVARNSSHSVGPRGGCSGPVVARPVPVAPDQHLVVGNGPDRFELLGDERAEQTLGILVPPIC